MQEYKDIVLKYYQKELQDHEREYYFRVFDLYNVLNPTFTSYGSKWDMNGEPKNSNPSFKLNSIGLSEENHDALLLQLFHQAIKNIGREQCVRYLLLDLTVYWSNSDWKNASVYAIQHEIDSNYLNGKPLLYPTNREIEDFIQWKLK